MTKFENHLLKKTSKILDHLGIDVTNDSAVLTTALVYAFNERDIDVSYDKNITFDLSDPTDDREIFECHLTLELEEGVTNCQHALTECSVVVAESFFEHVLEKLKIWRDGNMSDPVVKFSMIDLDFDVINRTVIAHIGWKL